MITAKKLIALLAKKHSGDIFVAECKNGPTQSVGPGKMVKLDAWAMSRSWSNPHTYGYEIKVTRSDFLGDEKWHRYLEYCSHFSFVAPPGIIEKDELPKEVGLILASKTGTKLFTKKKAPRRDVPIPESLFRYVLMCRANIGKEYKQKDNQFEFWQQWLADKNKSWDVGHKCSKSLRTLISKRIIEVECKQIVLEKQIEELAAVDELCKTIGLGLYYPTETSLKQKLDDFVSASNRVPDRLKQSIKKLHSELERAMAIIDNLENEDED